jgi:hypothetical protein
MSTGHGVRGVSPLSPVSPSALASPVDQLLSRRPVTQRVQLRPPDSLSRSPSPSPARRDSTSSADGYEPSKTRRGRPLTPIGMSFLEHGDKPSTRRGRRPFCFQATVCLIVSALASLFTYTYVTPRAHCDAPVMPASAEVSSSLYDVILGEPTPTFRGSRLSDVCAGRV